LSLAEEAWHSVVPLAPKRVLNKSLLNCAYAHCDSVTAIHSRSCYLTGRLLPAGKRRAMRALYAFCRVSDNIVTDAAGGSAGDAENALVAWRERAFSSNPWKNDPVAIAWADTWRRYRIPLRYAEQFIEGVTRDLHQTRYDTFADLAAYAYGVASTVALMSMHIIGFSGPEVIPYAIKMGVALQLTNILRDVGEDWRSGHVYLPAEELKRFGLTEADLAAGQVDDRWRAFMRFQIDRNRRLYAEAWSGIALLHSDGRLAVAAAGEFYRAILDDIEMHDYDVFSRRAHVSNWDKLCKLPGIWHRNRKPTDGHGIEWRYAAL
jgi:phytoene synthase